MGAEIWGEVDVFRLVEMSDEIPRLKHGAQHCRRIVWIRPQITIPQIMGREKWRIAGEIEHEIAA